MMRDHRGYISQLVFGYDSLTTNSTIENPKFPPFRYQGNASIYHLYYMVFYFETLYGAKIMFINATNIN